MTVIKAGTASVDVTPDYSQLKQAVSSIVTEYNKLRALYQQQSASDSNGNRGPLANDSVMRQVLSDIRKTLTGSTSNSGRYKYLSEVGVELTDTGDLKFVESKFTTAVDEFPDDLAKLFQGSGATKGVFDVLNKRLQGLDANTGLIKSTRDAMDVSLKRFSDRIDDQQMRLDIRRKELEQLYAAADRTMSQLTQTGGTLQSLSTRLF